MGIVRVSFSLISVIFPVPSLIFSSNVKRNVALAAMFFALAIGLLLLNLGARVSVVSKNKVLVFLIPV